MHYCYPSWVTHAQAQSELARSREEVSGAEQGQVTARAELKAAQDDCARLRWVQGVGAWALLEGGNRCATRVRDTC